MLVPLSWLREYVDIDRPAEEVAEILTNAGLEVKHVNYIGIPGAELVWDRGTVVLSHVLRVEPHPNADRLVLATVEYGAAEPKTVVTGAPNLFPYLEQRDVADLNLYSPLALEDTVLYDGHKEGWQTMKLKGRALRGIYNDAMLCSEKELGISEEHEGVILMRKDALSPDYVAGTPLQDVLGDVVLEIDIIPNIARTASMVGVAREYAALTEQPLRYPDYSVKMEGPSLDSRIVITTENPELNPRFVALVIRGVRQTASPYWMQRRLRLAGQRPLNVVVDVSNYVMLEMGQPNHTFDYDFLLRRAREYSDDAQIHISTRLPHQGETLTTLDGVTRKLPPFTILVTDPAGALSLGGVMGGEESEIRPETTNVLLEAAAWNFINIRRSSSELGLHSDAAFRFSRGVHPSQALLGAKRAAELLRRLAGGTIDEGVVDYYPLPAEEVTIALNPDYARMLSGLDLAPEKMAELLRRLEFKVQLTDGHLSATVPDHRLDIEGPHDLVEEICRMYGYANIPSTVIADTLPPQRGNPELEREEQVRDLLVRLGLQEVITYRLTSIEREARLRPPGNAVPANERPYVAITNPISVDRSVMRHSVLSSVLEIAAANSRFYRRLTLFEIGAGYFPKADQLLPEERAHLAVVMSGPRTLPDWHDQEEPAPMDFFDLKGVLEALFDGLHLEERYAATTHPSFRPGRTAAVWLNDTEIGVVGELHPLVVENYEMRVEQEQPVLAASLDLQIILDQIVKAPSVEAVSAYPAVREDLALVVDRDVPAADIAAALVEAGGFLLKDVELFDVYEGKQIPSGKKSLAYHLTFQSPSKTLTDKDVSKQRQRILKQLERRLGASLRD